MLLPYATNLTLNIITNNYVVKVLYPDNTPVTSKVSVQWCTGDNCFLPVTVNNQGLAEIELENGDYYIHIEGIPSGYTYDPNAHTTSANNKYIEIKLLTLSSLATGDGTSENPYVLPLGTTNVVFEQGGVSGAKYFSFTPTVSGKYTIKSIAMDKLAMNKIDPYMGFLGQSLDMSNADISGNVAENINFIYEFEAEAGEVYYLQFCAYDDTVTYDVTVVNRAEISHQPTEAEPYVEIAPEANASYQWFKVREGEAEITDKYIVDVAELDTVSTYSESKGWTPANEPAYYDADKDYYQFFWIYLEEGDKLTLDINGTVEEYICIESDEDYIEFDLTTSETNGSYTFEAEYTDIYMVYCYGEPGLTAKATVNGTYLEKIDGATDAALTPDEKCEYICMVTYDAGRYEISDKVEITEIDEPECNHSYSDNNDATCDLCDYNRADNCDCNCHAGGLKAFFFKLGNFFAKLFNPAKKICACGMKH